MGSPLRLTRDDLKFEMSARDRDCDCCGRLIEGGETYVMGTNPDGSPVRLAVCCAISRCLVVPED